MTQANKKTKSLGIAERIAAGVSEVPKETKPTPHQQAHAERLFGPIKAELKALGLPNDDLWWVVEFAETKGYVIDDLTYADIHEIVCRSKREWIDKQMHQGFDVMAAQAPSHMSATTETTTRDIKSDDAASDVKTQFTIPPEKRTKSMTKKDAVKLLKRTGNTKASVRWLSQCINDNIRKCDPVPGSSLFYFSVDDDWPEESRAKLKN